MRSAALAFRGAQMEATGISRSADHERQTRTSSFVKAAEDWGPFRFQLKQGVFISMFLLRLPQAPRPLNTGWATSICSTLKAYNLGSLAVRCILNAST